MVFQPLKRGHLTVPLVSILERFHCTRYCGETALYIHTLTQLYTHKLKIVCVWDEESVCVCVCVYVCVYECCYEVVSLARELYISIGVSPSLLLFVLILNDV